MVAPQQSRAWWPRIRWCLGLLLGTIILFVLFHDRNELSGTSTVLSNARPLWAVVALLSETLSLASFTLLQRRILHVGSVDISPWTFFPVSLANNSIANTLPGAPAFAGAFRFGQYRRIGADASLAGWTVLTQLLAATTGLAIIVLAGIVVAASGGIHQNILATTLVAFVVVLILGTLLVRRHLLVNTLASIIRLVQRITGHPRGNVKESIDQVLAIMLSLIHIFGILIVVERRNRMKSNGFPSIVINPTRAKHFEVLRLMLLCGTRAGFGQHVSKTEPVNT